MIKQLYKHNEHTSPEFFRQKCLLDAYNIIVHSSSPLQAISDLMMLLQDNMRFDSWGLFSLNTQGHNLELNKAIHLKRKGNMWNEWVLPVDHSILGSVYQSGQPEMVNYAHADPRSVNHGKPPEIGHVIAVPLNMYTRIRGMLVLQRNNNSAFTLEDFDLAQIFAGFISLAYDNVTSNISVTILDRCGLLINRASSLVDAWLNRSIDSLHHASYQKKMEEIYLQAVLALARAVDARDHFTGAHSQRLATWAVAMAQELRCTGEEIQDIHFAALLHDVGKIAIPDAILNKQGELTEQEWVVMKSHPSVGAEIITPISKMQRILPAIQHHHERYDGCGYPDGIAGDEIPLGARILKVVDVYGAVTEDRPYRNARSHEKAIEILKSGAKTEFDPLMVAIFMQLLARKAIHTAYD
jgi:putative nucleotidyltransferase with HDIG domain